MPDAQHPSPPAYHPHPWLLLAACCAVLMITMATRQTLGLFVSPINTATGLGIVSISFALAIGQFVWGASQPVFGALAGRIGALPTIAIGAVMLALGTALTPFVHDEWQFVVCAGLLSAAGAGAGSFSILIGASAGRLAPERRAFASGLVNAGGSMGQFVFAPLIQWMIGTVGWVAAMLSMAALALATIPLAWPLRDRPHVDRPHGRPGADTGPSLLTQLKAALRDPSYLCLHAGFFTCGFHVAFLITHLPGEIQLCGLPAGIAANAIGLIGLFNIFGSLGAGALGRRHRMKWLLFGIYASRAVIILCYLAAPKTATTFYVFAAALGASWLATVPPTAGLVGKLFGIRHLATLFGLTLLSHQIGAFFGAWLGGLARARLGDYGWMWVADIVLAVAAALVNLPIRETRPGAVTATA